MTIFAFSAKMVVIRVIYVCLCLRTAVILQQDPPKLRSRIRAHTQGFRQKLKYFIFFAKILAYVKFLKFS